MRQNESNIDRIIRGVLGAVLLYLYFTKAVAGSLGIVALVVGVIALITAVTGFCGIYKLLGISTKR